MSGGFKFGRQTLEAMRLLLADRDENALLACTLSRPYYEVAARLLWASREDYGWLRLEMCYAREEQKWAQEACSFDGTAQNAKRVLEKGKESRAQTDGAGKSLEPAPNMYRILKGIGDKNKRDGLIESQTSDREYANLWRWICRPAHAHPGAIEMPAGYRGHALCSAIQATWMLIQALCHVAAASPKSEIERIGPEFLELVRSVQAAE